ncbi:hypothetical protein L798_00185 [Zootermopsis nevadensis]|uniref:HMG box domain-containing protein n=1 Tax=Zootermopsis nevadensis TaxID=136037 RepID=A0A067QLE5_ZOONE|nr:hypothetical protein L798_00185 [Zootermopsis nevadensis]
MWKATRKDEKEEYFALARQVDAEHKLKYPDYIYNPKEACKQKHLRVQVHDTKLQLSSSL